MIRHTGEHIHMIGIGGAGMSPIAELLIALGYAVTGSDQIQSAAARRCESLGIRIQYDHTPVLIKKANMVVYSSAIRATNPEREYALHHRVRQIRRAEVLGDLMRAHTTVCIAGTHGKTTTTSIAGSILNTAGLEPTVLVGGMLREYGTHALIGDGKLMVAEADEYDRSFLSMYPTVAVITNIDEDHLDCYDGIEAIREAFVTFVKTVPFYGTVIACIDDEEVRNILPHMQRKKITYGIETSEADIRAVDMHFNGNSTTFTLVEKGVSIGTVSYALPGMHNIRNVLASIAVARLFGIENTVIAEALRSFKGVHRRFEVYTCIGGVSVIDDYAHHPREIAATLNAARSICKGNVVGIFQPHLYSRTRDFMHAFAEALILADVVVVTDIYKAREEPIEGVYAEGIVRECTTLGHRNSTYISTMNALIPWLQQHVFEGDYVVFMGAGDISETAQRFAEVYNGKA